MKSVMWFLASMCMVIAAGCGEGGDGKAPPAGAYVAGPEEARVLGAVRAHLDAGGKLDDAVEGLTVTDPSLGYVLFGECAGNPNLLHFAVARGWQAVAALLLDRGADVHQPVAFKSSLFEWLTPLGVAVVAGDVPMAKFLVSRGAKIGDGDLYYALKAEPTEMERYLLGQGATLAAASQARLVRWGTDGHAPLLRLLKDKTIPLSTWREGGLPTLAEAVDVPVPEIVRAALERGIDPDAAYDGKTARERAAGNQDVIDILGR